METLLHVLVIIAACVFGGLAAVVIAGGLAIGGSGDFGYELGWPATIFWFMVGAIVVLCILGRMANDENSK